MAKEFMSTAKELAWKAYRDALKFAVRKTANVLTDDIHTALNANETDLKERFENWWSDNYGNRDTTKFYTEHNVFIEGKRYIQAE
jgi:hypothetical protein